MSKAIETHSVAKIYQVGETAIHAVNGVSMQVDQGEFIALVGPSGSGKTTMLAILAALLEPSEGEAFIANQNIASLKESRRVAFRREKIGFTFQSHNLVPYLTVKENVELMLRLNKKLNRAGKEKARELLVRLGMEDRMNYLPGKLSGGQKQRVAIARSLIHDPLVVLADEPTASLDTERGLSGNPDFCRINS